MQALANFRINLLDTNDCSVLSVITWKWAIDLQVC